MCNYDAILIIRIEYNSFFWLFTNNGDNFQRKKKEAESYYLLD